MSGLNIFGFTVEGVLIIGIIVLQFWFYFSNKANRKRLSSIFPKNVDEHLRAEKIEGITSVVVDDYDNELLKQDIILPINSYLDKNKGATDYHIIKDLTDRACDKVQGEVESYNPVPLYLGLCGTMLGIILGIFFLWLGGGLDSLLASAAETAGSSSADAASQGIQHLLGGVAMAMLASLVGVAMTIISTKKTKEAVSAVEEGKNKFFSWVQCNLLPKMSSDVVSTLGVFYTNLNEFNQTFADNSKELKSAFEAIESAYEGQAEYTKELNKLDIAKAQLAFAALGSATDKINDLNAFLAGSSEYIQKVIRLNDKLDNADERTRAIEQMGIFFKNEIEQINARKSLLAETVGKIDMNLKNSLEGLQTSSTEQTGKLQEHLGKVYLDFKNAIADQQRLLEQKLSESTGLLEQFNYIQKINEKLSALETLVGTNKAQEQTLERIEKAIEELAKIVSTKRTSSPATVAQGVAMPMQPQDLKVKVGLPIPAWFAYTTCTVLIIAALFSIVFPILVKLVL